MQRVEFSETGPPEVLKLVNAETPGLGAGQVLVHIELTRLQLVKKRRVLLVDDLVTGQVFAPEREDFAQCLSPYLHALAWDGEHQIEIDVVEAAASQRIE